MKVSASKTRRYDIECDCLVEFVNKNGLDAVKDQPKSHQDALTQLRKAGELTDSSTPRLIFPQGPSKAKRLLVVPVDFTQTLHAHCQSAHITELATSIASSLKEVPATSLCVDFDGRYGSANVEAQAGLDARIFMVALMNATYDNQDFKGKQTQKEHKQKQRTNPCIQKVTLVSQETSTVKAGATEGVAVANGMALTRDLGDAPPNICNPQYLSATAKKLAKSHTKLTTKILGEKELKTLGAGAFLAVTQGSANPPQLILMEYKGGKAADAPIVLVGKGLTFDSGGISLKPGAGMDEMKYDMGGGASVFGAMQALIELNLPINVIGVVAAAENMPSDKATRPGDIVTTMSGQTVEILNTDAEGRLVLCDTLTYVKKYKPKVIIDLATLTGACIVALGHHTTAVMSNDQKLAHQLQSLGGEINDNCWQLPLWPEYAKELKSNFADIPNIAGKGAGTITAGAFLHKFVDDKTPWAHLDIAGVAWSSGAQKGATGRPVHLLVSYLLQMQSLTAKPSLKGSKKLK